MDVPTNGSRGLRSGGGSEGELPIRIGRAGSSPDLKFVNLALQGGGAHGAFAWGVLDRLLEDKRIAFQGISAASAGAINATVLACGLAEGGRQSGGLPAHGSRAGKAVLKAMLEFHPDRANPGSLWGAANAAKKQA